MKIRCLNIASLRVEVGHPYIVHHARGEENPAWPYLHVRKILWSKDGWPMVFLERYAGEKEQSIKKDALTGAWQVIVLDKQDNSPVPVFKTNEENGQYGPGYNSFTVSQYGTEDIFIYHGRNYKEIQGNPLYDPNGHTRAQKLKGNEDGAPDFGVPVEDSIM